MRVAWLPLWPLPLVPVLVLVATAGLAGAQSDLPVGDRPADRPIPLPELEPEADTEPPLELSLPPVPPPDPGEPASPRHGMRFRVRDVEFRGNTVFDDATLAEIAAPWLDRELGSLELAELREALTRFYVERGYVNSGATIPDQRLRDGVLAIDIVEGHLASIEIEGAHHFRVGYYRARIDPGRDAVLDVRELERRLQILQRDPRILSVRAHLHPGATPGEARLRVVVSEAANVHLSVGANNHQPPSFGNVRGAAFAEYGNIAGWGDRLTASYAGAEGSQDIETRYVFPLTPADTSLHLRYRYSDRKVIEHPFDVLDLETKAMTAAIGISQPLIRTADWDVEVGADGEWRRTRNTFFGGRPIDLSQGSEDGEAIVSVVRVYQQASYSDLRQAFAFRSTLSIGIDALGSTTHSGPREDSQFLSWIVQAQYFRRFSPWPWEVLVRSTAQLTNSRLLPMERFGLGGIDTVRGYRDNLLVRDNGWFASLEARLPIWTRIEGPTLVSFAPFVDVGRSWGHDRGPLPGPSLLASIGTGLRVQPWPFLRGEIYWGYQLNRVDIDSGFGIEHQAIYFRVIATLF